MICVLLILGGEPLRACDCSGPSVDCIDLSEASRQLEIYSHALRHPEAFLVW